MRGVAADGAQHGNGDEQRRRDPHPSSKQRTFDAL
jgi:hypothetical protein